MYLIIILKIKTNKKRLEKVFFFYLPHERTFARTTVRKGGGGFSKIPNKCSYMGQSPYPKLEKFFSNCAACSIVALPEFTKLFFGFRHRALQCSSDRLNYLANTSRPLAKNRTCFYPHGTAA